MAAVTAAQLVPGGALPTYDPATTVISRQQRDGTGAVMRREGNCLILNTRGRIEGQRWVPVWPVGTTRQLDGVRMPDGSPVPLNRKLSVEGRLAEPSEAGASRACPGRAFLVQRANQAFVWNSAAELVADASEVLVVELFWKNFNDPQPDGMLTSLHGTVVEAIKGDAYQVGTSVRLRLPAGITDPNQPQPAHDPLRGLYHAPAKLRILLFVDQEFYAAQARARKGTPLPGYLGGSIFYLLDGEQVMNDSDSEAPATLSEARRLAAAQRTP